MAGYSILGYYPVEVMHSFKFIRTWNGFTFSYVGVVHWAAVDGRPQCWT